MEPLAVAIVWNKEDQNVVQEYVDYTTESLSSRLDKPFSRTIDLPIFYYTNKVEGETPPEIKLEAEKIIIYVFIGLNSVACDGWLLYVENLYNIQNAQVVPIALDRHAFHISEKVKPYNFIRAYEFEDFKNQRLFIAMAHEIYRYGFNDEQSLKSKESALKIFLSHAKDGTQGVNLARQLKRLIDDDTVMRRFFDSNDIASGQRFHDVIDDNIKDASILIINSDIYSTRYWCQKEIQMAKEYERPIVEVNVIVEGMDRRLPFAGNVPVVRVDFAYDRFRTEDLYKVLEMIMIETIRCNYVRKKLEYTKSMLGGKVIIMCRPPEMIDLQKIVETTQNKFELKYDTIVYPDPPVYSEEFEFFTRMGVNVFTPIQCSKNLLSGKKIGISVSEPQVEELCLYGQNKTHIERLSQTLAKYILGQGGTLVYGGDLRKGGFTEQLLREAEILKDRLKRKSIYLINYISWPIYLNDTREVKEWKAEYRELLTMKEVEVEETVKDLIGNWHQFLPPNTVTNRYAWSKSLTKMRYDMIGNCDARICAGGKSFDYKGRMPGVLEEILIASELERPIYLLGGFGGVARSICEWIQGTAEPESLKEDWQRENNFGYSDLLRKYEDENDKVDYAYIRKQLKAIDLRNGLSREENEKLFHTVYVDEAVRLILKGLQSI